MWSQVGSVLSEALARLGAVLVADLPGLVAMGIVLAATFLLAFLVRGLLRRLLARMGFDRRTHEWGMTTGPNLGPRHSPSSLVARGAFWLVVLTGVALALDVLGASTMSALGLSVLSFMPRLVVGVAILVVGVGAARFLERSALIGAVNLRIHHARHLALGVKWLVLTFAGAMALEHVGVAGTLAVLTFTIVLGGLVLAAALAVGLGARDAVARVLERRLAAEGGTEGDDLRADQPERIQHL